jgi:hypothetical protein
MVLPSPSVKDVSADSAQPALSVAVEPGHIDAVTSARPSGVPRLDLVQRRHTLVAELDSPRQRTARRRGAGSRHLLRPPDPLVCAPPRRARGRRPKPVRRMEGLVRGQRSQTRQRADVRAGPEGPSFHGCKSYVRVTERPANGRTSSPAFPKRPRQSRTHLSLPPRCGGGLAERSRGAVTLRNDGGVTVGHDETRPGRRSQLGPQPRPRSPPPGCSS